MKKLVFISLSIICLSCSKSSDESEQVEFDFSYTTDTVLVDPGDGFIYLNGWLSAAALSPDKKQLYNYNPEAAEMEVIDLENLRLTNRIKMEKEGPQGAGNPSSVIISEDGKFFFISYTDVREFTSQLDAMKTYKIRSEKFEALATDEKLSQPFQVSPDGKYLLCPYGPDDFAKSSEGLAMLSLEDLQLKKVPIDLWERADAYRLTRFENGERRMWTNENVDIVQANNQLLLSSANFNEVYVLDLATDSISSKVFHSTLTENAKKIPAKTSTDSPEEMSRMFKEKNGQVNFSRFYHDDFSNTFYRFTRDLDRTIGDSSVYKDVVTIFDENLNQLHEEVSSIPFFGFKFFKDGKLYSYVNVEDELGFAVYTFDF